jgi:hypothetical protein
LGFAEIVTQAYLQPWYESLKDPGGAQSELLLRLLGSYASTHYGEERGASAVEDISQYRERFPPATYDDLRPHIDLVKAGDHAALLPEPPSHWVMTRGSTGKPKVVPLTAAHLDQVLTCGSRAILNFARRHPESEVLRSRVLNLNFPSRVESMVIDGVEVSYGYSSGTYARLIPSLNQTSLIPRQEQIDELGPGVTKGDWRSRFELAYTVAKDENVRAIMGVAPVLTAFGRYVRKEHHVSPSELWPMEAFFCTSVAKIQTHYASALRHLYGPAPVVEMYTATEGVYAQQLDDLPYLCPNYDAYVFEVRTGSETMMLHEMSRGQWGRLIVSSCLFPRYEIGDLVECMGGNYYRVFGRDRPRVLLEHYLYRLLTRWFI